MILVINIDEGHDYQSGIHHSIVLGWMSIWFLAIFSLVFSIMLCYLGIDCVGSEFLLQGNQWIQKWLLTKHNGNIFFWVTQNTSVSLGSLTTLQSSHMHVSRKMKSFYPLTEQKPIWRLHSILSWMLSGQIHSVLRNSSNTIMTRYDVNSQLHYHPHMMIPTAYLHKCVSFHAFDKLKR